MAYSRMVKKENPRGSAGVMIKYELERSSLERDLGVLQDAQFVACDTLEQLLVVEHLYKAVDRRITRFISDRDRKVDK